MFNFSLKFGPFPSIWKKSFIVSTFKSSRKSEVENYKGFDQLVTETENSKIEFFFREIIKKSTFPLNFRSLNDTKFPRYNTIIDLILGKTVNTIYI